MLSTKYDLLHLDNAITSLSLEPVKGDAWLALSEALVEKVERVLLECPRDTALRKTLVTDLTHLKAQICRLKGGGDN